MIYRTLSILLLLPFICAAQAPSFILNGSLGVESGETFTYQLVFTDSAGSINGYAVTYMQKEYDTRAAITGYIDRQKKTISFTETEIIYNHGFRSHAIICLIKSTLTYRKEGNSYVLAGPVTSKDIGNASCSRGSVRFEDAGVLETLFREEPVPAVTPLRPAAPPKTVIIDKTKPAIRQTPDNTTALLPAQPAQITEGQEKIYDWYSDTIVFEIWDGGRIDGDVVTVRYNTATILSKHQLTKEKKRIILPLTGKETEMITVVAGYEGNEPPNTANIALHDGDTIHEIVAHNRIGREAHIRIRKKQ